MVILIHLSLRRFIIFFFEIVGLLGKGKCGCPCRSYQVPKCEIQYVDQCRYEHYEQVRGFPEK